MERKTTCSMVFRLWDTTATFDALGYCTAKQSFSNLSLIFREDRNKNTYKRYGTLEQGQFLLDGNHELFPNNPATQNFGLWSTAISGANCLFNAAPVLEVQFTTVHSSVGITLHFDQYDKDYCRGINIKWYRDDSVLDDASFYPNGEEYFCENHVDSYDKLRITFLKTSKPYRYVKLQQIDFGLSLPLTPKDILNASLLEEINPISAEISINTLDFTLYSKEEKFCVVNPQGVYKFLQRKQRVDVYEEVNGISLFMGCQYFDTAVNQSAQITDFSCIDAIGLIDQTNFLGGMYKNKLVSELMNEIAESAGAGIDINLHSNFENAMVSGYLPICTHREALQQIAFAIGAVVDCSRTYEIKLFPAPTNKSKNIEYSQKSDNHSIKQTELVTSVVVIAHEYVANDDVTELFNGELPPGNHEIVFGSPSHSITIMGGTIAASNANRVIIKTVTASTVTVRGKGYSDNITRHRASLVNIPANERANELTVERATLVSSGNAWVVAQRTLDYYQNRLEASGGIILEMEKVSELVDMRTMTGQTLRGVIESSKIDLVGGFVADVIVRGKVM